MALPVVQFENEYYDTYGVVHFAQYCLGYLLSFVFLSEL
jgi:hypothetical protein